VSRPKLYRLIQKHGLEAEKEKADHESVQEG